MRSLLKRGAVTAVMVIAGSTALQSPAQAAVPVYQATTSGGISGAASGCSHPIRSGRIYNDDSTVSVGIGAIHLWDCSYGQGRYDGIVPAGSDTWAEFRWDEADGVYIGSGYCATFRYWRGSESSWAAYPGGGTYRGPMQMMFPGGGANLVTPFRC